MVGDIESNKPGTGARYNEGKPKYELLPTHLLESTVRVLEYGANKYAPYNWAKGMPFSVVIGCLKRHLAAIERGEDIDPETGQRHTGHLICNLLFLEHYMNEYPEMDDRPKEWFAAKAAPATTATPTWGGIIKDAVAYTKKESNDEQPTISTTLSPALLDPVVNGRVSNLRTDLQSALNSPLTFIYTDNYGVEYWRDSNGGVARYDHSGSRLD